MLQVISLERPSSVPNFLRNLLDRTVLVENNVSFILVELIVRGWAAVLMWTLVKSVQEQNYYIIGVGKEKERHEYSQ